MSKYVYLMCYWICVWVLIVIIIYYDRENRLRNGGICVVNYILLIDVIILVSDGYYVMVG